MAKQRLAPPLDQLESDIIETLLAGHKEWRPDLGYPQSHSDMAGAVRGLLRMFEVKRRTLPFELKYADAPDRATVRVPPDTDPGLLQELVDRWVAGRVTFTEQPEA